MIRLTQNQNESINSVVRSCYSKRLFSDMHCFTMSICETVHQFNNNLITQFNQGKGYRGIRTIKIFEFENTISDVKKCDH